MKKLFLLAAFLVLAPTSAFAALDITSVTHPAVVAPGEVYNLDIEVFRSPNTVTVENDWQGTKIEVAGTSVCVNNGTTPYFTQGQGVSTTTKAMTATSTDGNYDVVVKVYRDGICSNSSLKDTSTTTLKVQTPAAPKSKEVPSAPQGGRHPVWIQTDAEAYWYCPTPLRSSADPMNRCPGKHVEDGYTNSGSTAPSLQQQLIEALTDLIALLKKRNALMGF